MAIMGKNLNLKIPKVRILIVTALSQELNAIKSEIKKVKLKDIKISYLSVGKGNYNTVLNLTKFLENNEIDFLINIGICGYKKNKEDLIQIGRVYNLSNSKELIIPIFFKFAQINSIISNEKPILSPNEMEGENYVDMESYGFEMVCDSFLLPRMILKVPLDKIGKETINFDYNKAERLLKNNINYIELFTSIIEYLNKLDKKADYSIYFNHYNFTFSEKEIFKKLCNRYLSLVGDNIDKYFKENKEKNKEKFLKDLEMYLKEFIVK